MKRLRFLPFVVPVLLAACQDSVAPLQPVPEEAREIDSPAPMAIFKAASDDLPIPSNGRMAITVLDAGRTPDAAYVAFFNGDVGAEYLFRRVAGRWQRTDLVTQWRAPRPSRSDAHVDGAMTYTASIATLKRQNGTTREADWFINDLKTNGWKQYSRQYQTDLPYTAEFNAGTQTSGDTVFTVSFSAGSQWQGKRLTAPDSGQTKSCTTSTCDVSFSYEDANHFIQTVGAQQVTAAFYLHVVAPVNVTVGGQDSIRLTGSYTYTASPSGGDGTYTYAWQVSTDGGATWSSVGTGSTYTRSVSAGQNFIVKVTASSGGRNATAQKSVWVDPNAEVPLAVQIGGTTGIDATGTYTWTSTVSGGVGSYSYSWQYCAITCTVVSTDPSYSRYVALGDPYFQLILTVTAGGGQHQSGSDWHNVAVASPGGGWSPVK